MKDKAPAEIQLPSEIQAVFPGPNVGPEAQLGTLHPALGLLTPGVLTFARRDAVHVDAAIDAGLLAKAPAAPAGKPKTAVAAEKDKE